MWCFQGCGKTLGDAGCFLETSSLHKRCKPGSWCVVVPSSSEPTDQMAPRQVAGVIYTTWLVNKWIVHNRLHLLYISSKFPVECQSKHVYWGNVGNTMKTQNHVVQISTNFIPKLSGFLLQLWSPCNSSVYCLGLHHEVWSVTGKRSWLPGWATTGSWP